MVYLLGLTTWRSPQAPGRVPLGALVSLATHEQGGAAGGRGEGEE